jgi:hypothetical protein
MRALAPRIARLEAGLPERLRAAAARASESVATCLRHVSDSDLDTLIAVGEKASSDDPDLEALAVINAFEVWARRSGGAFTEGGPAAAAALGELAVILDPHRVHVEEDASRPLSRRAGRRRPHLTSGEEYPSSSMLQG